jgi:dihydrofolate synthase/folylpolyglutamate synthase
MNYLETIQYLYGLGHEMLAMKLGLETVRTLANACGNPQRKFPAIHIAGTNGKGSTAAMTESILRAAGYRAGLYTSPHLISITERIRVNGEDISEDDFSRLASAVRDASQKLVAEGALEAPPTFFEQLTMIAYLYFAEREVDLAVLEVGMGGRLDATNICEPLATAITPIGYDHQKYLGNTLAEIAGEKAGIIKAGVPVITAQQAEEAMRAIIARSEELNAPLLTISDRQITVTSPAGADDLLIAGRYGIRFRDGREVRLSLRGRHQVINALAAIRICERLIETGWNISQPAMIEGLSKTEWPGRIEMIRPSDSIAPVLLDGAHNPAGAKALRDFVVEHFSSVPITLIFGAMADKEIDEMIEILFPIAQKIIVTKVKNPRTAEPKMIAASAAKFGWDVVCLEDASEALAEAKRLTSNDGLILVCGSLFLVGEMKQQL